MTYFFFQEGFVFFFCFSETASHTFPQAKNLKYLVYAKGLTVSWPYSSQKQLPTHTFPNGMKHSVPQTPGSPPLSHRRMAAIGSLEKIPVSVLSDNSIH